MVNVSTSTTRRFIDPWMYFPGLIFLIFVLVSTLSLSLAKTLLDETVLVEEEEIVKVGEIDLQPSKIGALRIDVISSFDNSQLLDDWIVYEIQLIDKQGNIIASAIDEDWKQSGTWYEDGESGTWQESDLRGGIDIRLTEAEKIDVAIALLERKDLGSSQPTPVSFQVKIQNYVVDRGALFGGIITTLIIAWGAWQLTEDDSGKKVIAKKILDSEFQTREILGGKNNLVRITLETRLDENTPNDINIYLGINNSYGERVFNKTYNLPVKIIKYDNYVRGRVYLRDFLVLKPYDSYGFSISVEPSESVTRMNLEIKQKCRTFASTPVTTITQN